MKSDKKWMIYGANGYTGRIVVDEAIKRNLKPILAGRSVSIQKLAEEKGLEYEIFDLSLIDDIALKLLNISVLANCAGPFSATAKFMIPACIKANTHYIDITGEISVYDYAYSKHDEAVRSKVVLCPGVGSDVIPTDCLAVFLKDKCPDATHLSMAWATKGSKPSKGTAKTAVEGITKGGKIRKDGKIISVPIAYKERLIDFGFSELNTMTIPWGDIFTAYHSTKIPNIEFYFSRSHKKVESLRKQIKYLRFLKIRWVMDFIKRRIDKIWKPNTAEQRASSKSYFWGEVISPNGAKVIGRFSTADGYDLTAAGTVEVAEYLLGETDQVGYFTPTTLIGKELIEKMPGYSGIQFESL
ncbi:MAG: saccharopine dehydrogenase family protein [Fidelibacterota bacterium]|jgi:short subunit dehydrogenase-like uncharacterized protein|nr:hypothetical protein [Candidatus Neomarinimicrobiota bacterium]|tara:strand:+ start:2869 stop:3936 length:1068 start_codon:yes stop_codon:yes gene_type:complete